MQPKGKAADLRCPSCRTRLAPGTAICPICGHAMEVVTPPPQPSPEPAPDAQPAPKPAERGPTRARRFGGFLSRLPWGVFGVLAFIALLGGGALYVLRGEGSLALAPTPTPTRPAPTSTPSPRPTAPPTPTVASTPTAIPPTPTLPPRSQIIVRPGDTCGAIADRFDISIGELTRYNNLDASCLIVAGNTLLIPPIAPTTGPTATTDPNATAAPTSAAGPTATFPPEITYEVRAGDVCGAIAEKFRVTVLQVIQQNNLDAECTIRVGQQIKLRFGQPTPAVTNTPFVAATPTPRTGYSAPVVMSPPDNAVFSETHDTVTLQWLTVGTLKDDEWYVVHVQPSGAVTVPLFETKGTSLKLTRELLGSDLERAVTWWVEVKRNFAGDLGQTARAYVDLSPPSAVRRFTWRRPAPTPSP